MLLCLHPMAFESSLSRTLDLGQQIPSLLEHRVHVLVERREGLIDCLGFPYRLLSVLENRGRDLFPLRHLRQRGHSLELIAECLCVLVVRESRILPRRFSRREIARQSVEFELDRWPREILHQLPCFLLVLG